MKKFIACVLLVGCGGDDSGGGNGTVPLDDLGMELAITSCAQQFDCCTDAEIMAQYMGISYDGHPISTEAECVEFSNALLTGLLVAEYKESLAAGRIEYDGAAAADCVAALGALTCTQYSAGLNDDLQIACGPFVIPKVGDGGACGEDYECTSGYCVGEKEGADGAPDIDGTCMPVPTMGQTCTDDCASGLYCVFDQSGMKTCQPLKADGTQCNLDSECTSDYCDDTAHTCGGRALVCDGR